MQNPVTSRTRTRSASSGPILATLIACGLLFALASCGPPAADRPSDVISIPRAINELALLPVKGRAAKTGYSRQEFGRSWADTDGNGCDTRNDILARDLTKSVIDGECRVRSGSLTDPYSGRIIDFRRGEQSSADVQIDHVVSLSNAWQTGAQQLTAPQRLEFANDPSNLMAVDGPTNSAKGDGDAATWLPPRRAGRCAYVARQISVKVAYRLWVTSAEKSAMSRVLTQCPVAANSPSGSASRS
ncbi:MAG: HNH endonuclease family protein [Angustibacter sp.]